MSDATGGAEAARSDWVARLAHAGFAVRGVLYVLLVYLRLRAAFGQTNRQADRKRRSTPWPESRWGGFS